MLGPSQRRELTDHSNIRQMSALLDGKSHQTGERKHNDTLIFDMNRFRSRL